MANQRNLFQECYSGDVAKSMPPDAFKQTFCLACRNLQCTNAKVNESKWMQRMLTQEDVLLRNPRFADPNDPLFRELQAHDFKDKIREALAIEISSQKGDWSIPSEEEVQTLASRIAGFIPPPSEAPPPPPAQEWVLRGDTPGSRYVVKEQAGSWVCTCKGFEYQKSCKHILDVQQKLLKAPPIPQEEPVGNKNLKAPDSSGWYQAQDRNLVPKNLNTKVPTEGVFIGTPPVKSEEPPLDPWAPPKKEIIIPVGGKIVMGGKREP